MVKEHLSETLLFTFTDDKKKILFIVTKKQILKYKNNINQFIGLIWGINIFNTFAKQKLGKPYLGVAMSDIIQR